MQVLDSLERRAKMVQSIRTESNKSSIINNAVLMALGVAPRHLFVYGARLPKFIGQIGTTQQDSINAAYLYNKPIPATAQANEASPELIGTMLSLTEIIQGQTVLLVGINVSLVFVLNFHCLRSS